MSTSINAADKPLTPNQQTWLDHLNSCERDGCSSVDYAREHGLSIAALYAARKDLTLRGVFNTASVARRRSTPRPSSAPVTLVPVKVNQSVAAPPPACLLRVVLPNGLVIEVPQDAEPGRCAGLVSALSGVAR